MKTNIRQVPAERQETALSAAIAAAAVLSVSGLVKNYGLFDRLYFNKGLISAVVFVLAFLSAKQTFCNYRTDKRTTVIALVISFLLALTEILGNGLRLLANDTPVVMNAGSGLWMFISAFFLSWILSPAFFWLLRVRVPKVKANQDQNRLNKIFLMTWLSIFAAYLPCFLAFYPGLYCYDMIWQWEMFASGIYNTHHPLIHTLLSGSLFELGKNLFGSYNAGLAVYALLQLAALSGSAAFAVRYLVKVGIPGRICVLAALFYALFPFFPVSGISTTKDIYFGSLLLLVFVCICDMVGCRKVYRGLRLMLFLAAFILMGTFRNNAVYAVFFTIACLLAVYLYRRFRHRDDRFMLQLTGLFIAAVIGIQGAYALFEKGLDANQGSVAEMLSVPCQQLARTYVFRGDDMEPGDKEALFRFVPEAALARYKYYVSDPVKAELDSDYLEQNTREFFRLWREIGSQFPQEFILAPLYNTMGIWYLGGDSSCYVEYNTSPFFDETHTIEPRSFWPGLKAVYTWFNDANIQRSLPLLSMIFYTSFYAWMVVAGGAVVIRKRQYHYLIPLLLLVGYMLTLLLGPCITVRYMLGIMLCVPCLLPVAFCLPIIKTARAN